MLIFLGSRFKSVITHYSVVVFDLPMQIRYTPLPTYVKSAILTSDAYYSTWFYSCYALVAAAPGPRLS